MLKPFSGPIEDADDIRYIESCFSEFTELCTAHRRRIGDVIALVEAGELPHPTYELADRRQFVPQRYFTDACGREEFADRLITAAAKRNMCFTTAEIAEVWQEYLSGGLGVCLRSPTPENIVTKLWCIATIERLTASPKATTHAWREALQRAVDTLDSIEGKFTCHDRRVFGSVSRDKYITDVRKLYGLPQQRMENAVRA